MPREETASKRSHKATAFPLYMVLIVVLMSFALYLNAIPNGFVIDDIQQVAENPWIRSLKYIPEIFSSGVWAFEGRESSYYRPLTYIVYLLCYTVFGLKPWGFHLANVVFHTGVCVIVYLLASKLLKESQSPVSDASPWPPFLAAILFAAHPIHVEAVAWVAGLMDVGFTFFYLLSFYLYMKSVEGGSISKGVYRFSVVSFFLSTFFKEPALTLPFVLIAYDFAFRRREYGFGDYLKRYLPYFAVVGAYLLIRTNALGGFVPVKTRIELTPYQYLLNSFVLFAQYLKALLLPVNLNASHVFSPVTSILHAKSVIACIVLTLFLILLVAGKRNKIVFFGLCAVILPLLPGLYLPALGQGLENAFAERYLYLPSFGFVLLGGAFIKCVWENKSKKLKLLILAICLVVGAYSVGTISRNFVWENSLTLWSDAVKKSPNNAIALQNLGHGLYLEGRIDEAIERYKSSLSMKPDLLDAEINLGVAYHTKGLLDKAIERYLIALKLRPNSAEAHNNLGLALVAKGLIDEAIEHCQVAVRLKPNFANAHNNLGVAFGSKGIVERAVQEFQAAVRLDPANSLYRDNLTKAYGARK